MTSVDGCNNDCGMCNDVCEIERLRALINAWCDAEDASNALWAAKGPRKQDAIHDAEAEIDLALTALRKAVGR